ncbi:TraR/DksA family transcriptional regulator [Epibacterium ulvae]|uniref:Transcriptional regulator, TraR/DksA family n=1 Tax=Epibacterium ulvae TaxID=1156985 RepID=A0A1G5PVS0_9RHOB|nr:TraR/DksA C4-type zinc finger protein [Epibacterium ulvae]SCZ53326.1 transcriptional regulator, TraR/DksA family [Epibacterium ulvae]
MDFAAQRLLLEQLRHNIVAGASSNTTPIPGLQADNPGDWHLDEVFDHLDAKAQEELRQIEAALARLTEGSYGFCHICGDPIDDHRLETDPANPICSNCKP